MVLEIGCLRLIGRLATAKASNQSKLLSSKVGA